MPRRQGSVFLPLPVILLLILLGTPGNAIASKSYLAMLRVSNDFEPVVDLNTVIHDSCTESLHFEAAGGSWTVSLQFPPDFSATADSLRTEVAAVLERLAEEVPSDSRKHALRLFILPVTLLPSNYRFSGRTDVDYEMVLWVADRDRLADWDANRLLWQSI